MDRETHCEHDPRYIVSLEDGTHYCEACEQEASQMTPEEREELLKILCPMLIPSVKSLETFVREYEKLKDENRRAYLLIDALIDEDCIIVGDAETDYKSVYCVYCGSSATKTSKVVHHPDCQVLEAKRLLEESKQ